MNVELIDGIERLEELREPWDALAVGRSLPYAAPAWQLGWWYEARPAQARVVAAAAWDGDELVALAPMYVVEGRLAHCAPLAAPAADGITILVRRGAESSIAELAPAIAAGLPRPLVLTLRGLPLSDEAPKLVADGWPGRLWVHREPVVPAPEIELAGSTFEQWQERLGSSTRQHLRRRRRRLLEAGATFRVSRPEELERDIATFAELHRGRWESRGGSAVLAPGVERMVLRAARELAPSGRFRLYAIDLDGRTISTQIVLAAGERASHWLGGIDSAAGHFQPGVQAIYHAIEAAFAAGDGVFDLGAGAQQYKSHVADGDVMLATTALVPRGRGYVRARASLLPRHLHQAAAARVPEEQRRRLKRLIWNLRGPRRVQSN